MRRVLIDECINPRLAPILRSVLPELTVETIRDLGWRGEKDHLLIPKVESRFDIFVTIDKGFEFEHDLKRLLFGIILLSTKNNQMSSYERLLSDLVHAVQTILPGQLIHVMDPEC